MERFNDYLAHSLDSLHDSKVKDAMLYSLLGGGKRVRPALLLATLRSFNIDEQLGYSAASAIEMIHTYSLIHDDLPAMDNDTLRRGRPTCHVQFDEATAILAGDGLLTQAFVEASKSKAMQEIIPYIATYSGSDGMILGQSLDLKYENMNDITIEQLKEVHYYKTGKLLTLPLICACCIADKQEFIPTFEKIGMMVGLSFQIQDDILDVTSSEEVLGKNIGSDDESNKTTYVKLLGIEEAKKQAENYYDDAMSLLAELPLATNDLEEIFAQLKNRNK